MGVVVVGSAGNEEVCTECVKYPAAYVFDIAGTQTQVIAVSATMANDNFRSGWTYSPGSDPINDPENAFIDVAAPGDSTLATGDGVYVTYSYNDGSGNHTTVQRAGTSFSGPQVSALSALLLSVDPNLTVPEVYMLITGSADKVGQYSYDPNGWNRYLGYGRINAESTVCSVASACQLDGPSSLYLENAGNYGSFPHWTWVAPPGVVDHYKIYRKDPGSSVFIQIGTSSTTEYTDHDLVLSSDKDDIYYYKVSAVDFGGTEGNLSGAEGAFAEGAFKGGIVEEKSSEETPSEFRLWQNYPNPFNPSTEIRFDLPEAAHVSLVVYDVMGREIATLIDGNMETGYNSVRFDATDLPSGVYLYRIEAGSVSEARRMTVLR